MNSIQPADEDPFARQLHLLATQNISRPSDSPTNHPPKQFITKKQLLRLWKINEIRKVLRQHRICHSITAETIRDGYLCAFSMLVWCGKVEDLSSFTSQGLDDHKFPLRHLPEAFAARDHLKSLFQTISTLQWTFFPLLIHPDRLGLAVEPPERVLPIMGEVKIAKGEEATVFKSLLHPDCCDEATVLNSRAQPDGHGEAVPRRRNGQFFAVRKVYNTNFTHRPMFDRERNAYQALRSCQCEHIVDYYGAFIHRQVDGTEVASLLLEYVEGLNLEEFFLQAKPPRNKEELLNFWGGFEGLFEALHHIFNHKVNIAHQDISPFNLMVSGPPNLDKKLLLKVTDFGHSYTATQGVAGGQLLSMMGGRQYGAPQSCYDDHFLRRGPNIISPAVDVWSAGAIMSDAAAWVHGGQQERDTYDAHRLAEVMERPSLEHFPYFHNGVVRLGTVDRFHRKFTDSLAEYDLEITKPILTIVEQYMLPVMELEAEMQKPSKIKLALTKVLESATHNMPSELTAEDISAMHDQSLADDAPIEAVQIDQNAAISQQETSSTPDVLVRPLQPRRQSSSPRLYLSWEDARQYYLMKKNGLTISEETLKMVKALEANLSERDYIFLVDTSGSMQPYQAFMRDFLLVYTYIAKNMDSNGLEVCYTSSGDFKSYTKSSRVVEDFDKQPWTGFGFEDKFGNFISEMMTRMRDFNPRQMKNFKPRLPKKQSIFVLTDGRWGGLEGIKENIRTVTQAIRDRGYGRTQFTIQFVSFGSDPADLEQLDELDNFGRQEGMDIVDTKPFDFDVCAVLYGAIDETADGQGEPEPAGPSTPMSPMAG